MAQLVDFKFRDDNGEKSVGIVTVDQAVYAKAVEVCNNPRLNDLSNHIVLRLGAFHTSMTFMAVIGCPFGSAGLRDILIKSGVLAEGTVDKVLSGHQYNRGVNSLKAVYEALWRLWWEAFLKWNEEQEVKFDLTRLRQQVTHDCATKHL